MTESSLASLSWCPASIAIRDFHGQINIMPVTIDDDTHLPHIEQTTQTLSCIYLPLENLLVRTFNFPLKHPRFLDANMLAQELADSAGIEPDDWWLTWHANSNHDGGISGIVFALPKPLKHAIQQDPMWQHAPFLLIDGWERLNHCLDQHDVDNTAIIDADSQGLFLGYYKQGVWLGMRRLNIATDADINDPNICEQLCHEVNLSLQAMGFDAEQHNLIGRIPSAMKNMPLCQGREQLQVEEHLGQRHIINLNLPLPHKNNLHTLNIRHGKWAAKNHGSIPKVWWRSIGLAIMASIVWLSILSIENYQLRQQLDAMNNEIIQAFHRGLPQQTVIIDAMAQLRQATHTGDDASNSSQHVTTQLNIISAVFKKHPWHMQELRINNNEVVISGQVNSLDALNDISNALQEKLGQKVKITDTDLKGNEVTFRMRWS
ncbi:GspL/Epsl periplasmic domain-containing protein [Ghiorsea bivora]|uniref:GspL/Epsl periplasmic domain-containing protein n=1 Tax=Ghiorsea bivora TaxID=1485545 RepID=UPI00056E4729|nr:GspL/Epsl periplasmic domain-containing protein [Ghiorsea bivora]